MAKILIVDDDPRIVKMLNRRLKKAGYDIVAAENGQVGVDMAFVETPALILMDMHMPVMDGYTATACLRQCGYQGVIVALTASAMAHNVNKSLDAGCDYFIPKPIDSDFEQQLQHILEARNGKNSDRG